MKILMVDDDESLISLHAAYLAIKRPDWAVESAHCAQAALELLRAEAFDLLVADIQMPEMDGLELLRRIRQDPRLGALPVILATGMDDRPSMRKGMHGGADDYLTKPFTGEELVEAIESRAARLIPPRGDSGEADRLRTLLTPRELEVLGLIGKGLSSKEIAVELQVSPHTVSVHRSHLMAKLDLHNAPSLASLAVRLALA